PAAEAVSCEVFIVYGDFVALLKAAEAEETFVARTGVFDEAELAERSGAHFRAKATGSGVGAYHLAEIDETGIGNIARRPRSESTLLFCGAGATAAHDCVVAAEHPQRRQIQRQGRTGADRHVKLSDEDLRLRQELRDYLDRLLTDEVRAGLHAEGEAGGPVRDEVMRRIGADGWFGIGWPEEFGGQDRGHRAQFILYSEAYRAQAPLPMVTLTTVAPTIMSHGSQEQKDYFLPKIAAGELVFSI